MSKEPKPIDRVQLSAGEEITLTPEGYRKIHEDLISYAENGKPLGGFYPVFYLDDIEVDAFVTFSTGTILILSKRFKYAPELD